MFPAFRFPNCSHGRLPGQCTEHWKARGMESRSKLPAVRCGLLRSFRGWITTRFVPHSRRRRSAVFSDPDLFPKSFTIFFRESPSCLLNIRPEMLGIFESESVRHRAMDAPLQVAFRPLDNILTNAVAPPYLRSSFYHIAEIVGRHAEFVGAILWSGCRASTGSFLRNNHAASCRIS